MPKVEICHGAQDAGSSSLFPTRHEMIGVGPCMCAEKRGSELDGRRDKGRRESGLVNRRVHIDPEGVVAVFDVLGRGLPMKLHKSGATWRPRTGMYTHLVT